jgi:hypothetical protein
VTGPGGTGKSYLLKALKDWCIQSGHKPLLLAPTGIAANNISGGTIHSILSLFTRVTTYNSSIFLGDLERANAHDKEVEVAGNCFLALALKLSLRTKLYAKGSRLD